MLHIHFRMRNCKMGRQSVSCSYVYFPGLSKQLYMYLKLNKIIIFLVFYINNEWLSDYKIIVFLYTLLQE